MTAEDWKQALWEFLLEHSDVTPNGSLFVKFHCDNRENFEKRVIGRHNGYHREDIVAKEELLIERRTSFETEKRLKKRKYKRGKKIRTIKRNIINIIKLK